jgi:S-layer homology domain
MTDKWSEQASRRAKGQAAWAATLGLTTVLSSPAAVLANVTFPDVQGHWAQSCIEELAEQGIVQGYPDGRFQPDLLLTRGEFASMVSRAYPAAPLTDRQQSFFDVPSEYWGSDSIRETQPTGFFSGYPGGDFRPEDPILRVEALVALANGLGYAPQNLSVSQLREVYLDAETIPTYALSAIAGATEQRLVVNYPNFRQLNPNEAATRAEASAFLCQARAAAGQSSIIPAQYIADIPDGQGAFTQTQRVQGELVLAQLSYQKQDFVYRDLRLTVVRGGKTIVEQTLSVREEPRNVGFKFIDLDGDVEPELVVDFFAPAPRCCSYSLIYRYVPQQNRYVPMEYGWDAQPPQLKDLDLDGLPEFEGYNTQFANNFATRYEEASYPRQIFQYRQGELFDVTRQYPDLVQLNAWRLWDEYQERLAVGADVQGVLAAYLVDKYTLGEGDEGWQILRETYQGSDRDRFFSRLETLLSQMGYAR